MNQEERKKCVFLDRDGVLNRDRGDYTYELADFEILPGVVEALKLLKEAGFLIIVITNQAGIAKGRYTKEAVKQCHEYLQQQCGEVIDALYYAPYHESVTASLTRKPNSLMLEKAIAKYKVDVDHAYMVGDQERDLVAAHKAGVRKLILVDNPASEDSLSTHTASDLLTAVKQVIL
ncbi:HAD family hydrolase [Algivirga pacifica]|uniref:D,D-heptose 1,7-bisphosphate phosphatase n=1 Tax=Algivirga pacifica TaxID=1162670 RepID=A0ABP9DI41_9BACT